MSAETISFRAETRARALDELARRPAPVRARVFLDGPALPLASEVVVRVAGGLVVAIEVPGGGPALVGARALLRVFLAEGGRIELRADEIGPSDAPGPRLVALAAEAEAAALALTALATPLGGLGGVLVADLDSLVEQLAALPDAVSGVLRLADGERSLAAILRNSPYDELLTARILERLRQSGILHVAPASPAPATDDRPVLVNDLIAPPAPPVAAPAAPEPADRPEPRTGWDPAGPPPSEATPAAPSLSALPTEDELEGDGVETDIRTWLENEHVPEPLLSADAFERAFALAEPELDLPHPEAVEPEQPPTRPADPEVAERAPVGPSVAPVAAPPVAVAAAPVAPRPSAAMSTPRPPRRDPPPPEPGPTRAVLVGALVVLVAIALAWSLARERPAERAPTPTPQPPPRAAVATTTTATLAVAEPTSPQGGRVEVGQAHLVPSIAGPNAPEEVKRAEALLDAGQFWDAGRILAGLRESRASDPSVWVLSGQLCVNSGGRFAEALAYAERALTVDPRFYRAWVLKGSALQFLGRRDKAAEAYQRALALEPGHPMSAELGTVLRQLRSGR